MTRCSVKLDRYNDHNNQNSKGDDFLNILYSSVKIHTQCILYIGGKRTSVQYKLLSSTTNELTSI
jgi:hypothetical protein